MRSPSDALYQLIHSLTKQEKRYFKIFAGRHITGKENQYLTLFTAMARQKEYDEKKLIKAFKGQEISQVHVIKNYLYAMIMRSLRNFHSNEAEDKFHETLRDAQILYDKGLHSQSRKALTKARKYATDNEEFLHLLQIKSWEHRILHQDNDLTGLDKYIGEGVKEEMEFLDMYSNILQMQAFNDKLFVEYCRNGIARTADQREVYSEILRSHGGINEDKALSFEARFYQMNASFTYYFCIGELDSCYDVASRMVLMIEEQSRGLKRYMLKYISCLNNLYAVQKELRLRDATLETLHKLRNISAKSTTNRVELFMRSYVMEMDLYLFTGDFEKARERLGEMEEQFHHYRENIDKQSRLAFYYNFSYLYFGCGNYSKALDWNNDLLNDKDVGMREDIHCFARILNLIIHYELGNDQLIEYIAKSTYRYLYKRKRLFQVETCILNFIRKYPFWVTKTEFKKGFGELLEELRPLEEDAFERHAFEYFDFITWLESKLEGTPFGELKRDKEKDV